MISSQRSKHELVVAGLVSLAALWVVVREHVWVAQNVGRVGVDEGYLGATAMAMIQGRWLPYVDAAGHRGPMLYWCTTLAQWLAGQSHWTGIRALSSLAAVLNLAACFGIGVAVGRPVAGALATTLLAFVLVTCYHPATALGLNGEPLGTAFLLLAMVVTTVALRRWTDRLGRRSFFLAIAGALCALSALTKQTLIVGLFPLLLLVLLHRRRVEGGWRLQRATPVLVGAAVPIAIVVGLYGVLGELRTLWYWAVEYNRTVYMAPYRTITLAAALRVWFSSNSDARATTFLTAVALLSGGVLSATAWRTWRASLLSREGRPIPWPETQLAICLGFVLAILAAAAPMRFWPHYFLAVMPWAALVGAFTMDEAMARARPSAGAGSILLVGILAIVLLAFAPRGVGLRLEHDLKSGAFTAPEEDPICQAIRRYTPDSQPILVWGFDGDVYVSCNRRPATKFVFSTVVAGVVPPFWSRVEPAWTPPDAQRQAAEELKTARPPVVVENQTQYGGPILTRVPILGKAVTDMYCPPQVVRGARGRRWNLYLRQDLGCEQLEEPETTAHTQAEP